MSSMEISNLTKETLIKMFSEGKRFDSRELLDFREFEVTYNVSNKAEGSARVRLGKTDIVVGIKMGFGEALKIQFISLFYGFITPARLGSFIKIYYFSWDAGFSIIYICSTVLTTSTP